MDFPVDLDADHGQERREVVGAQLAALLRETTASGSRALIGHRVMAIIEAERSGELPVLRAALMELAVASGAWAAALDEHIPPDPHTRRVRRHVR